MRPHTWVYYNNVNGDQRPHSVWMNVGGLGLTSNMPLTKRLKLKGEAGLGVITRHGFSINGEPVLKDASYATILVGGGLEFQFHPKWGLNINAGFSPGHEQHKQSAISSMTTGISYKMQELTSEKLAAKASSARFFPKHLVQVGYSTNRMGYHVNDALSERKIAIFWGGTVDVRDGINIQYQRNIFHTAKMFSMDIGASLGSWTTKINEEQFFALSVFPVLRLTPLRTRIADVYVYYSIAGPSIITDAELDNTDTGKNFTFQDLLGLGIFGGKDRNYNAEVRIGHFSNGNVFSQNAGIKIPLTFCLGYTW
jgi:hypothetical protein